MAAKKSIPKNQLLILLGIAGLFAYLFTFGKNTIAGKHADNYFQKVKGLVEKPLAKAKDLVDSFGAPEWNDPAHHKLRDACLEVIFLEKSGFHFSQSRWGGAPVPYQFRGLEVVGPEKLTLHAGDIQRGIDLRICYTFKVSAWRRYNSEKGEWDAWKFDSPPNLSEMVFVREDGAWRIASAPHKSFAIR